MNLTMPMPWDEDALRVFALGEMRAVGGCVRDALLGLPVKDIDFATPLVPTEVMARAKEAGLSAKPTGLDHGTVTVIVNGKPFEVTTLRRDVATDGRRAVIAFSTDWAEDAQRRDLTINAFYADIDGAVFDVTGQGEQDLQDRVLRFIGAAETRIREDYLRILRLFRFAATLPGFSIDTAALKAVSVTKEGLSTLSRERVTAEFARLLQGASAPEVLAIMTRTGVAAQCGLHPDSMVRIKRIQPALKDAESALLFAMAFEDAPAEALRLSSRQAKDGTLIKTLGLTEMSEEEAAYRHGLHIALSLYLWRVAVHNKTFDPARYALLKAYVPPEFQVTSAEFQAKGLEGPALGAALRAAEERWIANTFENDSHL